MNKPNLSFYTKAQLIDIINRCRQLLPDSYFRDILRELDCQLADLMLLEANQEWEKHVELRKKAAKCKDKTKKLKLLAEAAEHYENSDKKERQSEALRRRNEV